MSVFGFGFVKVLVICFAGVRNGVFFVLFANFLAKQRDIASTLEIPYLWCQA